MKVNLAGERIREIRDTLGMSVSDFAAVIAVHPGTVHRWESAGTRPIAVDGVAAGVLAALDQRLAREQSDRRFRPAEVGDAVKQALIVGGALLALGMLIAAILDQPRR